MLIAMAILCAWLGLTVRRVKQQMAAIKWVEKQGGWFTYDYDYRYRNIYGRWSSEAETPNPKWLYELVGVDYLAAVVKVDLSETHVTDMTPLMNLPNLWQVVLSGTVTGEEVAKLQEALPACEFISPPIDTTPHRTSPAADSLRELTNSIGMRFRLIPAGEFTMGGEHLKDERP